MEHLIFLKGKGVTRILNLRKRFLFSEYTMPFSFVKKKKKQDNCLTNHTYSYNKT